MQEIICILDVSGSMATVANDAVGGFNQFLEDQLTVGDANITVVLFDHNIEIRPTQKLSECKKFTDWPAGGMTALYDAIGKTFAHVNPRFAREKPEKVVMAILTDGHENSSREYDQRTIADLIREHEDKYGWDVIYLGADHDVWDVVAKLNIKHDKAFVFQKACTGQAIGATYSSAVTTSRTS